MPRKYRMGARAVAVAATRHRIVEAAKDLHARQGLSGTSFEEIAQRAGIAEGTVYRHFPTLEDLIPACAGTIHVLQAIRPEQVAATFPTLPRPSQRMEWLIQGTCDCYQRDGGWLQALRREEDLIPALGEAGQVQRNNLRLLVRAALRGTDAGEELITLMAALIDFPLWHSLCQAGFGRDGATERVLELVRDQLDKAGID